jgi:hypothetical protein
MNDTVLNSNFALRDQGLSNALGQDLLPRHRWYFVKEGFSPKLVQRAIATDGVRPGEVLLDPFSGSGTVPLTAALGGLVPQGIELNPFLRFLSATKLRQASPVKLRAASCQLLLAMETPLPSALEGYSTFTKGNRWKRWLFPRQVIRTFEAGRCELAATDTEVRPLLRLALLGAAMDCCNAARDGKCLRYTKKWRDDQSNARQFRDRFQIRTEAIAEDLASTPLEAAPSSILQGDARTLVANQGNEKFRLCITSPPYLNSFDYSDVYRPELFLGGFVRSNRDLMKIRLKTIRSHVQASWEPPKKEHFGTLYDNCIEEIRDYADSLWDPRLPTMIQAYFEDMEGILRGLRQRAHTNASLWLVVSTSAYAGVEVPVDLILAEIGQRTGWFLREVGVLRYLRSSSQHVQHVEEEERKSVPLRESVVILDATKRNSPGCKAPRQLSKASPN